MAINPYQSPQTPPEPSPPPAVKIWNWNEAGGWYLLAFVVWPGFLILTYFTLGRQANIGPAAESDDFRSVLLPVGAILNVIFAIYIARSLTLWTEIGAPLRFGSLLRTQVIPLGLIQRIWIEDGSSRHPIGWIADAMQKDAVVLVIEINHYNTLTTRVHRKYFPALTELLPLLPQFGNSPMYDDDPKEVDDELGDIAMEDEDEDGGSE